MRKLTRIPRVTAVEVLAPYRRSQRRLSTPSPRRTRLSKAAGTVRVFSV
jgi:hypothetical protein